MTGKNSKLGFTMAEMMVCLSVIAVIATILIPTISTLRPDKEKTMFKKAYQITERIVSELVNDPDLYPNEPSFFGFDNIGHVPYNGRGYGAEYEALECDPSTSNECTDESILGDKKKAKEKFCLLFATKLNTITVPDDISCIDFLGGANVDFPTSDPSFTTTDGIAWYMPATYFTNQVSEQDNRPNWVAIFVDVNGDNVPNKFDNQNASAQTCSNNEPVDRFAIFVRSDGKVTVSGACAISYLQSLKIIPEDTVEKAAGEPRPLADGVNNIHTRDSGADAADYWDETAPLKKE